jgi:hypothetical protein
VAHLGQRFEQVGADGGMDSFEHDGERLLTVMQLAVVFNGSA